MALCLIALAQLSPAWAKGTVVVVGDDYFDAEITRIPVGTQVDWRSRALLKHTITADDGTFHSKDLSRKVSFSHRFNEAGAFRYFCRYHGAPGGRGMSGVILVGNAELPAKTSRLARSSPATLEVPQDFPSIQDAVDASAPGDLVLVSPGTYKEAVIVDVPNIVIRGTDRHDVTLDGEFVRANGFLIDANGVAIENLTARNYIVNGFYWAHVRGYRGSYISAIRNGDYGIYTIESRSGTLDHVYTSGSPDGGIYIGACAPCDAIVTHSLSEFNELGFSGTNASGNLTIVNSEWRNNRTGILPNTLDSERFHPQHGAVIKNNWVHDNGDERAPFKGLHYPVFDAGIGLVGTRDDLVTGNTVTNNKSYGILVMPGADLRVWLSAQNVIENNRVEGSGRADLSLSAPAMGGDCFKDNTFSSSLPAAIEARHGCGSAISKLGGGDFGALTERLARAGKSYSKLESPSYKTAPFPGAADMPDMPDSRTAPPRAANNEPSTSAKELASEPVTFPRSSKTSPDKEVHMLGIGMQPSGLGLFLGLYAYALPFALYGAWMAIALWDLARRDDMGAGKRIGWGAAVMVVPFAGPAAYLLAGGGAVKRSFALFIVFGGIAIYAGLAALTMLGLSR